MLQLPFYYILEKEISTGANTDIAKMRRGKKIIFAVDRWMQCLLLWLKSRSVREASCHADFMSNCLAVSHTCLLYRHRRWVFLFVPGVDERNEHARWVKSFLFLFLVLIRWNEERRRVQDFLLLPQGFESFPSDLLRARSRNFVCV